MSASGGVCPKEKNRQSDYSPCVVADGEILARIILKAQSADERGRINKSALKLDDFVKKDGWSFVREKFSSMPDVIGGHVRGKARSASEYGYASVNVRKIRDIVDGKKNRAVCVIDDGKENNRGHALAQKSRMYAESDAREIRRELLGFLSEVKP